MTRMKKGERFGFVTLAYWEGTVTEKKDGEFVAVWYENGAPEVETVMDSKQVSEKDFSVMTVGTPMEWWIGHAIGNAQETSSSRVRMARVPAWTRAKIEAAKLKARNLLAQIDFDRANRPE